MLAILATHPIQYQVPIWRALAAGGELPFKVYYLSRHGLQPSFDAGFGQSFAWDIDLLQGYPHAFLDAHEGKRQDRFDWLALRRGFADRLRADGASVLWVQGWQVLAYWQAVHAARRAGLRVWIRGDTNLRSSPGRGARARLKRLLLRRLLDRVDRFLVVGEANRRYYRALGYPDSAMDEALHCVENARFAAQAEAARPGRDALRAQWGIGPQDHCVLFVGKFVAKKRPFDLLEAARRLQARTPGRRIHLLWVGAGGLGEDLRARCAQSGLDFTFAGFLNQGEIARAYVAADVLVLPSEAGETWGLVVNEAMATGLPCITSDACGCAEDLVAPLRPDLVFPLGDVDALAASLHSALQRPPAPDALRGHIARYDVSRTAAAVAAAYRRQP